jgi:hypothetical protein
VLTLVTLTARDYLKDLHGTRFGTSS